MAIRVVNCKAGEGPGRIMVAMAGDTPDEANGPEARRLAEQAAIRELRNSSVFLQELQPMAFSLSAAGRPIMDPSEQPAYYGAVFEFST